MFNIKKYEYNQNLIKNYKNKIELLEDMKRDVELLIQLNQDSCNHDLILCYENEGNIKKSQCLFCNSYMELDDYVDIFSERYIDENSVIDVSDLVSEYSRRLLRGEHSVLILKAKEKLEEMIVFAKRNNREFKLDLVKNVISNTLIAYDEELRKERRKKLIKE